MIAKNNSVLLSYSAPTSTFQLKKHVED